MFIRSFIFTVFLLLYLALGLHLISCDTLPDIQSDPSSSLLSMLKNFVGARNEKTRRQGKQEARDFIMNTFKRNGLQVWIERADIGKSTYAENIVGMIRSNRTGSADDKMVIVGAHYDTTEETTGVDDNGSGVTALLQVAKNIGKARCQVNHTVLFVAFDFEEWNDNCSFKPVWPIACGSNRYVKNLTTYLSKTGGTVSGAIILETMLNHNSSAGSQTLPPGFDRLLPDDYAKVKNDNMRGNFLAVVGRKEPDKRLLSLIGKYFPKDSGYRAQLLNIPVSGRPSIADPFGRFSELYRSDHYEFWNANASYSALMLTDTSNFRGYMQHCYHQKCDDLRNVKEDDLEFLRRSINSVIKTVLDLSEAGSCHSGGASFGGVSLTFVMLSTMIGTYVVI